MTTSHRILTFAFALCSAPLTWAQAAATGTLTGRVTDAGSHLALAGAHVSVDGTPLETYTETDGSFTLSNVPAGPHTVHLDYVGYGVITRPADVTGGRDTHLDVVFEGDTVHLEKFVITGSMVGTARAINQERAAAALTNIIASDAIGKFPDENAAESLQRVPGLALYRDQGEGRFIIIRGVNSQYNHVELNGATLATPESGSRNVPLDVMGSDSLGALEVNKVVTPDMSAEGLGGSVNLRTRTAFDAGERQLDATAQTLYSDQRDKFGHKFNLNYGDFLLDGKLGIFVGASMQRRPYGSNNYEEADGWSPIPANQSPDGKEHYFFNEIAYRDYEIVRTRNSGNASIDYKPDATTTIYIRGSLADFTDRERRWVTDIPFSKGTITALTDTSASVTGVTGVQKQLRVREKDQKISAGTLGFEKETGDWKFDGQFDVSEGKEAKPNELQARFDSKNASNWNYNFTDPYHIVSTFTGGDDPSNPASFSKPNKGTLKQASGEESQVGVKGNALYNFELSGTTKAYLKFGGAYRAKDKSVDKGQAAITAWPSGYSFPSLAENAGNYPYFTGPRINAPALQGIFFGNPAITLVDDPASDLLEDFDATENVAAGYAMGGATFGKLNLIAGLRAENTEFETKGYQGVTTGGVTTFSRASASHNYTNVLPGVILRYDATKQFILRASLTKTLARPDFVETALSRSVDDDENTVSQGNPNLKPLESLNWDISADYYLQSLGVVSVAAFYKDIKNFTYQAESGTDATTGFPLTTYLNGSKGHIAGLELAYQQQFRFLPAPFDGLGFLVNGTITDSSAEYPTRPGEKIDFVGQSKFIGNIGLTYEKSGFFARVAGNFRTKRLREDEPLGADPDEDRYVDRFFQLDATASYKFAKHWEVFVEALNLTNEPFRVYFGGGGGKKFVQFEEYGWSANTGLRWKL